MKTGLLAVSAIAVAGSLLLGGCPAEPSGTGIDFDALSPPPGNTPLNTNLTSSNASLTDLSKVLASGAVPTVITTSSGYAYIGADNQDQYTGDSSAPTGASGATGTSGGTTTTGDGSTGGSSGNPPFGGGDSGGGTVRGDRIFHGNVSGTRHEDLDENGSLTQSEQRQITIGLSGADEVVSAYIPGFVFYPSVQANVAPVGATQHFEGTANVGNVPATYSIDATLRSADFGPSSGTVIFDLQLDSIGGSLITEGTGVHTLNVSWSGASMSYSSITNYSMVFRPAPGVPEEWYFTPTVDYTFQGTLVP